MRNFTEYDDLFIEKLIELVGGYSYRCTATPYYGMRGTNIVLCLTIWQESRIPGERSACIFCEDTELLDFCEEMQMYNKDVHAMLDYYRVNSFQNVVNDLEYQAECDEALYAESYWYSHVAMLG